jgi:DegV family protein with EDD domain
MQIITDSTCNLTDDLIEKHHIQIAPIPIQFGDQTYEEDIDIDRDAFYNKIEELGIMPTSSQPSPARFARFYQEAKEKGEDVLAITITSKHSGTYNSAILAKSIVPEADVEVFDSRTISLGTGWMVLEAARAAAKGITRDAILTRLSFIRDRSRLFITPSTMKYLQMSGRVGQLQGALASLLQVKPIITVIEGTLEVLEKARTRKKALDRLLSLLEDSVGNRTPVNLAVIHARALEDAQLLVDKAKERFNSREILTAELVASLAVHGGPGIIGLFAYPV